MSEEQLSALLAKLKGDVELQERLKGVTDLDAAVAIAKEAGFTVTKEDFIKHQSLVLSALNEESGWLKEWLLGTSVLRDLIIGCEFDLNDILKF